MKQRVFSGRIINLERERVRLPNDVEIDLDVIRHPGAAAVVASTGPDVILIRQYRFAAGGYLWEIPAGTLEPGESPDTCARRELGEEAGVEAAELVPLGHIVTAPGFCDERIHIYLARNLRSVDTAHDRDEVIAEVRHVPWVEVFEMIDREEIIDSKTLSGLFRATRRLGLQRA